MSSTRKSVLVVEDEVILALDISEGLKADHQLDVAVAYTLKTAVVLASERTFDYALLDLNLGLGENSADLGQQMADRGTFVVFTSGYNRNEVEGIDGFALITKPFVLSDVEDAFGLNS